jgi:hypothetical protein
LGLVLGLAVVAEAGYVLFVLVVLFLVVAVEAVN